MLRGVVLAAVVAAAGDVRAQPTPVKKKVAPPSAKGAVAALFTKEQYARLKKDDRAMRKAVEISVMAQQLGGSDAGEVAKAVEAFSRKPTAAVAAGIERKLVAKGFGLPTNASQSGLSAKQMVDVVVIMSTIGEAAGPRSAVDKAELWSDIKKRGRDAVMADRIREAFKIPVSVTKGLTARQLMQGVAGSQRTGKSGTSYWKGYASKARGSGSSSSSSSSQSAMPKRSEMPGGESGGWRSSGTSNTGGSGLGGGGPLPGSSAPAKNDTWTTTINSVERNEDGSTRITFTVTAPDGSKSNRSAIVETDGSSAVFDGDGDLIDGYGPGENNNVNSIKPGDTYTSSGGEHKVVTDADQSAGGGNNTNNGDGSNNNNTGNGDGSNNNTGSGDGSNNNNTNNNTGSGDGSGNGDGTSNGDGSGSGSGSGGCSEQEGSGCANETKKEEEKPAEKTEEEPTADGTPNPMSDDPWAGPPLWMMVRSAWAQGGKARDEKGIALAKGGGHTDDGPLADRARRGAELLLSRTEARFIIEGVFAGRGGHHTDPSPLSDGPSASDGNMNVDLRLGGAIDRVERAPVQGPINVGKAKPKPIGPVPTR